MKELTIEEKAEAYDEAIKRLEDIKTGKCQKTFVFTEGLFDYIFPEPKENEDERIRKALIRFHKSTIDIDGIKGDDILAWLEKQGSQNLANSTKTCKIEQKSIDKVEPKFHKGQWIACEELNTAKIVNIDDDKYEVEFIDGNKGFPHIDYVDRNFHLYTIQDAKDGDVLVDGNLPFIFKKIDTNKHIYAYCGISVDDGFKIESDGESGEWTWMQDIKPATEEQRDVLFAKMREAGYEWDAEKKELKKVKIEPIDEYEGLTDFEKTVADVCIGFIGKEPGWEQYIKDNADALLKIAVKKFNAVRPKQKWSVCDEDILNDVEESLEAYSTKLRSEKEFILADTVKKEMEWIKSLKEGAACEANCTTTKQWKPSEEQMIALRHVISGCSYDVEPLLELEKQLKKL